MRATPRAEALRAPLAALLRQAQDLYAQTSCDPATATRVFRAVIPDVVAAVILPDLLFRLAEAAPGCRLELSPWRPQAEQPRDLDLVITTEVEAFPDYRIAPLYQDHDILAFSGESPAGDLFDLEHVAVVAAGATRDSVDRWLAEQSLARRIATVVPHYLLALQLVARGRYVAVLPSRMIAALGAPLGVRGVELPTPQEPDQQWIMRPPQLDSDPANAWLREQVLSVVR